MEFLCSFLRRDFARKPLVVSQNVGCFLKQMRIYLFYRLASFLWPVPGSKFTCHKRSENAHLTRMKSFEPHDERFPFKFVLSCAFIAIIKYVIVRMRHPVASNEDI